MPRFLSKNTNGNLDWTEEALDIDGDEIFLELVEVESINGAPPPSPNPSWLTWSSSQELLANGQRKLTVELTVVPDSLVPGDTIVFGLECRDALSENVRREVTLTIGDLTPSIETWVLFDTDDMGYFEADFNLIHQFTSTESASNPDNAVVDEINENVLNADSGSDNIYSTPLSSTDTADQVVIYNPGGGSTAQMEIWYAEQKLVVAFEQPNNRYVIGKMDLDGSNYEEIAEDGDYIWVAGLAIDEGNDLIFITNKIRDWIRTLRLSTGAVLNTKNFGDAVLGITLDKENQDAYFLYGGNPYDLRKGSYDDNGVLSNITTVQSGFAGERQLKYVPEKGKLYYIENNDLYRSDLDATNQELVYSWSGLNIRGFDYKRSFTPELV